MADNIKGISFSTADEGVDFPTRAKLRLVEESRRPGSTLQYDEPLTIDEVYVVNFGYAVGNWKANLSTSRPDGRYFEVTYNVAKKETYLDGYVKYANVLFAEH